MRFIKRPGIVIGEDLMREVSDKVEDILSQIKKKGWESLVNICQSLDGIAPFRINPKDMTKAWRDLSQDLKDALKMAEKTFELS